MGTSFKGSSRGSRLRPLASMRIPSGVPQDWVGVGLLLIAVFGALETLVVASCPWMVQGKKPTRRL